MSTKRRRRPAAELRRAFALMLTDALLEELLPALPALIGREIDQRLAQLHPLRYVGVYDAARDYAEQECVTSNGSMWVALAAVRDVKPGTDAGAGAWQLVVKRGKDGRDGRDGREAIAARNPEASET
jgi:hypothetical protein